MKNILSVAVILFSFFTLSACGIQDKNGQRVNIDSSGENITVKSEDGESQFSAGGTAKMPDNFPKELVVVDDAKVILSTTSEDSSSVAYGSNVDLETIKNKYLDLEKSGWKKVSEVNTGEGSMYNFSKDKMNVVVNLGLNTNKEEAGKSFAHVILVIEKE